MRLIINNQTDKSELEVLAMVQSVMLKGKCSFGRLGKQYCALTLFQDGISIECRRNKKSFSFTLRQL